MKYKSFKFSVNKDIVRFTLKKTSVYLYCIYTPVFSIYSLTSILFQILDGIAQDVDAMALNNFDKNEFIN